MKIRTVFLSSCVCLLTLPALAAGTKRVDPLLEKAILESADIKSDQMMVEAVDEAPEPLIEDVQEVEEVEAIPPDNWEGDTLEEAEAFQDVEIAAAEEEIVAEEEPAAEEIKEKPPKQPGFRMGSFMLLPTIIVEEHWNDNVQAAPDNETEDFITVFKPNFRMELQDSPHEFMFGGGYERQHYQDEDDETVDNWYVETRGYAEIRDDLIFPYEMGFYVTHEDREDDLARQLPEERTQQKTWNAMTGFEFKPDPASFALIGRYNRERFDDGISPSTGPVIRRDGDRATWQGIANLNYEFSEDKLVYLKGIMANREYKRRNYQGGGFNGAFRDSDWYEFGGGVATRMKGFKTDIGIGYKEVNYDTNFAVASADDVTIHADMEWAASENATLLLSWHRDMVEDDEVINLIRQTNSEAGIQYAINDSLSLGLAGTYEEQKFMGAAREDDTYGLRINADYQFSPRFAGGLEYRIDSRDSSSGRMFEYDRQIILARMRGDL